MELPVECCPRCSGYHACLKFKPLRHRTKKANVWTTCPDTKEPILGKISLSVLEDEVPEGEPQPPVA